MPRPIVARIDLAALRGNFAIARRHAGRARIWSVIKADGYGHGMLRVARALDGLSDGFAIIELDAAQQLRTAGLSQPILMMEGFYAPDEVALYAELGLTPVIHRLEQAHWLIEAALPMRLPVYLKIDTGMHRLGLTPEELSAVVTQLTERRAVSSITLMTHFADADGPGGVAQQMAHLVALPEAAHFPISMANSAALLRYHETVADWVRPGIMLYGASPFVDQTAASFGLRPVMSLCSELIAVREIGPGDAVGYGGAFVAERSMRIGIVACGYADGYPRHAPTGTPVLVADRRTRTLGRVSMDKLCVDLTGIDAEVGTPVVLWGEGQGVCLPADEVASAAGTISYELFCALARRVPAREVG